MSETSTPTFDGWTLRALRNHIEQAAPVIAGLDDDRADLRDELRAEYDAAVAAFKARSPYGSTPVADGGQSVTDLVDEETTDDHFLRHVTPEDTTFMGRHDRTVSTTVEAGELVHHVTEQYADDAHGESLAWKRGTPRNTCDHCDGDLDTDDYGDDGHYVETADCPDCAFTFKRVSVDAPMNDSVYMRPVSVDATVPHDWESEADVDWDDMRDSLEDDADLDDLANVCRALSLRQNIGLIRDAAYDSDDGLQTVECGHCESTIEEPAAIPHAYFGTVCPACEGVEVWTPDDADLPDAVNERMDTHKTFNVDRIVPLLRDVIHYSDYRRSNVAEDKTENISEGISTGRGGERDAHGLGRGTPGTGLRRPNGAFHGFTHWRTVLQDAYETGLIERADDLDVDAEHKKARWVATETGRDVFDDLAHCPTCGGRKQPYKHIHTYQSHGKYTNKDSRLTLACADCDQMSHTPRGMAISSSTGRFKHDELDGVKYEG